MHSTLPAPGYSPAQRFGAQGEAWALDELTRRGYVAETVSDWAGEIDLVITGGVPSPVLVEVKIASRRTVWQKRADARPRWRVFYSWEVGRLPETDLAVALVADSPTGRAAFVVPSWAIAARNVAVIHLSSEPDAYAARGRGWLAEYFGAWERTVGAVAASRARQAQQLSFWRFT